MLNRLQFQGIYCLHGSKANVEKSADAIKAGAKKITLAMSDTVSTTPYLDGPVEKFVYTNRDAVRYQAVLPGMKSFQNARKRFFEDTRAFLKSVSVPQEHVTGVTWKLYKQLGPRPSQDWRKFESNSVKKCRFVNADKINLEQEIKNRNFSIITGKVKSNPPGYQPFHYRDLDTISKSEVNMALAIKPDEAL